MNRDIFNINNKFILIIKIKKKINEIENKKYSIRNYFL